MSADALVKIVVDGKEVATQPGTTVLDAALAAGIYIPHLCYWQGTSPYGGCRLCLVEVEGLRAPETSCTIPVKEGMTVRTTSPGLRELQRNVLEVILSQHPDRCLNCPRLERCDTFVVCQRDNYVTDRCVICPANRQCELQRVTDFLGLRQQRFVDEKVVSTPQRGNAFIERNEDLCIYCTRCVRVCDEMIGVQAFGRATRGRDGRIKVPWERDLTETSCIFCGQCALACPVGAIMKIDTKYLPSDHSSVRTTCPYCSVGCSMYLNLQDGRIASVLPDPKGPANHGVLCVKGHFGTAFVENKERLKAPAIRDSQGKLAESDWDSALSTVAARLNDIRQKHGPDSIGVITSSLCTNEENYLLQKLARAVLGTNNVDEPSARFHQWPAIEGTLAAFGVPGMHNPIADIDNAGCIVVIGSNITENHPIIGMRVQAAARRGAKVILVDPRETEISRYSYLRLQLKPGTDAALVNGMLRVIVDEGLVNEGFVKQNCEGYEALKVALAKYDLARVAEITGVSVEDIQAAARLYATGGKHPEHQAPKSWLGDLVNPRRKPATGNSSILSAAGVTQHRNGSQMVQALADLALLTGNIGKKGAGLNVLSGKSNTQGACDIGSLPNYLPGYQRVGDAHASARMESVWGVKPPATPGRNLMEMLQAAKEGKLKALYVVGSNLMLSVPDRHFVEESLKGLEFLVVQDLFLTETAELAHVVLPGASFAEKNGTFTNTERRVQRVRQALEPVGSSRADWQTVAELGRRLQQGSRPVSFDYVAPAQIMGEIARVTPLYGGISYDRLEQGAIQWPCATAEHPGTAILFEGGLVNGKAKLAAVEYEPHGQAADSEYPLLLNTGRQRYLFNSGALTDHAEVLGTKGPCTLLEVSWEDAAKLSLHTGDRVKVHSRRGKITAEVTVTQRSAPGQVFAYIHLDGQQNRLLGLPEGSLGEMPELKQCAVRIEKLNGAKA